MRRCSAGTPGDGKIVSEDAVRRGLKAIDEEEGPAWLRRYLGHCLEPLLNEPWIVDVDTTIKPLYFIRKDRWSAAIRRSPAVRAIVIAATR